MENDFRTPDSPKPTIPSQTARDPLIRYSVFAALGCAGVCVIFTILYIFSYLLNSTLFFERHFDAYLMSVNSDNISTILGLHMNQNRMFLQSCGMVAGIFFACFGLALCLVAIQGATSATGEVRDDSISIKRLAPGGIILLVSMIFVGVSAMHPVDISLGPITPSATAPVATATQPSTVRPPAAPATAASATQPPSPAAAAPSTLASAQPAQTSVPATAAQLNSPPATQPAAVTATPATPRQLATQRIPTQPATMRSSSPARPPFLPFNQTATNLPPFHRFQP